MHTSGGPPCVGGAAKGAPIGAAPIAAGPGPGKAAGAAPKEEEGIGALPKAGAAAGLLMELDGATPFTGGKAGSFAEPAWPGSGAGNVPCAKACAAWNITAAKITGAINRRIIKAIPSGKQHVPDRRATPVRYFTIAAGG